MLNRPILDDQIPAEGAGRRRRARVWVAGLASLVVIAGLFVITGDGSDPAVQVSANQPGASLDRQVNGSIAIDGLTPPVAPPAPPAPPLDISPTTAPPPLPASTTTTRAVGSTTSTAPQAGSRTPVMAADDGQWKLTRVDSGSRRCLELTVRRSTTGRLLCDTPAATGLWGRYAIVDSPIGWVVVAMVDRRLTAIATLFGGGVVDSAFGADPVNQHLFYAVGVIQNLGGSSPDKGVDLFLLQGENTLGRAPISLAAGPHEAPNVVTAAPYGSWANYRKAGYTGLFWGGNEDVGFYDSPSGDGTRCVLWRRFGGPREGVILDVCPASADAVIPFGELWTEPGTNSQAVRAAVVVDAPNITRWGCTWDGDSSCFFAGHDAQVMVDPAGSGRSFLAYFPGAFTRHGDRMTVTLYDNERILTQITLTVQPG